MADPVASDDSGGVLYFDVEEGDEYREGTSQRGNAYCLQRVWLDGIAMRSLPLMLYVGEGKANLLAPGRYKWTLAFEVSDERLNVRFSPDDVELVK